VEDVGGEPGRRLLLERRTLADPEAVLLVDDHQRQVAELDGLLDERVRPHHHRELARLEPREYVPPPTRRRRAREERDREVPAQEAVERGHVLLGQRLGWRHQRGLAVVLRRAQHRVERDDGLA